MSHLWHVVLEGLALTLVAAGFVSNYRRRKRNSWLEYIRVTPLADIEFDSQIEYRLNENWFILYGKRGQKVCLPPVERWPEVFPAWVVKQRSVLVENLANYYTIEWIEIARYAAKTGGPAASVSAEPPSHRIPPQGEPTYRWEFSPAERGNGTIYYFDDDFRLSLGAFGESGNPYFSTLVAPKYFEGLDDSKRREILDHLAVWCRKKGRTISVCALAPKGPHGRAPN